MKIAILKVTLIFVEYSGIWREVVSGVKWYMAWSGIWREAVSGVKWDLAWSGIWHEVVYGVKRYLAWRGIWREVGSGVKRYVAWSGIWREVGSGVKWDLSVPSIFLLDQTDFRYEKRLTKCWWTMASFKSIDQERQFFCYGRKWH
jgi:hypothetical protein